VDSVWWSQNGRSPEATRKEERRLEKARELSAQAEGGHPVIRIGNRSKVIDTKL